LHTWCGLSVNLGCRSETCCEPAGSAGPKKSPKSGDLGTIAKLCRAISPQIRHVLTVGKKTVKQQCLPHTASQYGEHQPTSRWDLLASLGHPCKFQRVSRLGSVTAATSLTGGQPNFARCLAVVTWAGRLLIHFRRLLPGNGILPCAKFTLRPPSLALSYWQR